MAHAYMAPTWPTWSLHAPHMVPTWSLHGPYMATWSLQVGPSIFEPPEVARILMQRDVSIFDSGVPTWHMAYTWPLHGPYMTPTWPLHGPYIAPTWPLHGPYMYPWSLHGYMVLTWSLQVGSSIFEPPEVARILMQRDVSIF